MEVQKIPNIDGIANLLSLATKHLMDPILSYIRDGQLPSDPSETRQVRVRAAKFSVVNHELYKRRIFTAIPEMPNF